MSTCANNDASGYMGNAETRMRATARDPQYHPVLILWPNNNASSKCAEIDYAEGTTETAQMKLFLHHACGGSDFQTTTSTPIDPTQWHNYAVEWTPSGITGDIDGVKTFTDTNPAHQPGVGMHQTLQLDWFPTGGAAKSSQCRLIGSASTSSPTPKTRGARAAGGPTDSRRPLRTVSSVRRAAVEYVRSTPPK
ncbi:glycoside hydrolase family 16 protein [Arthrobacter livingstonensis]|uniref:glycoside hydrolase family 16 protein n=1 Tax=Arthrobacter livingstonensis TaxID=670078 RepID=UPI001FE3CEA2|nr:glycoside hydrolase family 16 protein [Arthrobacter livingstonensis]